jgi:hypothetical protein
MVERRVAHSLLSACWTYQWVLGVIHIEQVVRMGVNLSAVLAIMPVQDFICTTPTMREIKDLYARVDQGAICTLDILLPMVVETKCLSTGPALDKRADVNGVSTVGGTHLKRRV